MQSWSSPSLACRCREKHYAKLSLWQEEKMKKEVTWIAFELHYLSCNWTYWENYKNILDDSLQQSSKKTKKTNKDCLEMLKFYMSDYNSVKMQSIGVKNKVSYWTMFTKNSLNSLLCLMLLFCDVSYIVVEEFLPNHLYLCLCHSFIQALADGYAQ